MLVPLKLRCISSRPPELVHKQEAKQDLKHSTTTPRSVHVNHLVWTAAALTIKCWSLIFEEHQPSLPWPAGITDDPPHAIV
jgi:hypothetical protein